jgi:predicted nuclease of restriction endonuclease-like (RecB) superfamily
MLSATYQDIQAGIVALMEAARTAAARSVNSRMTATYWEIGRRVVEADQEGAERAAYGKVLIPRLAKDLTRRFGRGFSERNLEQMRQFYLCWPIPQTLSANSSKSFKNSDLMAIPDLAALAGRFPLPWSAYVRLLSVRKPEARAFYEAEVLRGGWSVRQLDRQVNSQFYERALLSRNQAALLQREEQAKPGDALAPDEAVRDPFVLEFLGLKDEYSESELEEALIRHLAEFLLELGDDFAFVGRQRRLRIDDTWFRVDLLFFHRRLKCLVVVDLKVGEFTHADAGQMHLYLNYARAHWMCEGENPPVGLILCAAKGAGMARYALDNLQNKVLAAEYQTLLPDEQCLAAELERTQRELERRREPAPTLGKRRKSMAASRQEDPDA